jgi:signal transduction histidine kinase
VIESLDEGIVVMSERGDVIRINESARRLLHMRADVPFPSSSISADRTVRAAVRDAMQGASPEPTEVALSDHTLLVTARPIQGRGAVMTIMDLTPRRRLEAIRRDFVANVSHELKTPLTVISGFAETLREERLTQDERERFVSMIEASARRMQRVVDDLLDLSRYETGGWAPNITRNELRGIVTDIFTAMQQAAGAKGLVLAYDGADGTSVWADSTALRQVLANLVENAVRYTTHGGVTVVARDEGGGVWIRVSDTGSGIAAEHLGRIFERFYRVDTHRGRDEGGTGLGLAIVKHLVDAHHGTVTAESVVGRGTTISVVFPNTA